MARLTPDQWAAIREEWETDPKASHDTAAKRASEAGGFECPSREIVRRTQIKDGWAKRGQLADIGEAAQRRADKLVDSDGCAKVGKKVGNEVGVATAEKLASRIESEIVRAEVLARHRTEWGELQNHRKAALVAMQKAQKAGDKESWQIAKIAADTAKANLQVLEIQQLAERRAWGLNELEKDNKAALTVTLDKADEKL